MSTRHAEALLAEAAKLHREAMDLLKEEGISYSYSQDLWRRAYEGRFDHLLREEATQ